jgi:hypothetical protein
MEESDPLVSDGDSIQEVKPSDIVLDEDGGIYL